MGTFMLLAGSGAGIRMARTVAGATLCVGRGTDTGGRDAEVTDALDRVCVGRGTGTGGVTEAGVTDAAGVGTDP